MRRPLSWILAPFPAACFAGTFLTDLAYWRTAEMMWADFSAWLVSAGVILGIIVAVIALVDVFGRRFVRGHNPRWPQVLGAFAILVLEVINMLVHTRDAWTSVVPWGLTLSTVTVLLMLAVAWMGRSPITRYRTGALA